MSKTGIIIQARTGSTRLPNKMILDFANNRGIFELILNNLTKQYQGKIPIILATSLKEQDDILVSIADKFGVEVVRGSESDVMNRFDMAMEKYGLNYAIRVCADNPLLDVAHIKQLIETGESENLDYVSFAFPDKHPVIKSHLGLFTEFVSKDALERIRKKTDKPLYFEHVTNFIYENPQHFTIKFLPLPKYLQARKDLRFTLDTKEDFELMQKIYQEKSTRNFSLPELIYWIDRQPEILKVMQTQIIKNSK